jgi:hypothetical protein
MACLFTPAREPPPQAGGPTFPCIANKEEDRVVLYTFAASSTEEISLSLRPYKELHLLHLASCWRHSTRRGTSHDPSKAGATIYLQIAGPIQRRSLRRPKAP